MIGCDVSNWSVVPSAEQVQELKALGIEFAVVGTSYGTKSAGQLAAFLDGGVTVAEYQFPQALRATLRPWWVDAEQDAATLDLIRNALRIGAQGVYTRRGWALDNYPDWDCRAEYPEAHLWDARYVHGDGPCRIQFAVENGGDIKAAIASELAWLSPFKPYWGFTEAAITQWHNSVTIAGVNVDLNVKEDDVTQQDKDEIKQDIKNYLDMKLIQLIAYLQQTGVKIAP